jgi:NSS family neurotransmitter:Na+ symporter
VERWSSRIGFLLATIGSAVGIGNVWRFSSILGQNGGGAYLVPYLCACFLCAVPLMVLELSVGRQFRGTVITTFQQLGPRSHILGWFIAGVLSLILSYYLVITGWTMAFSWYAISGQALDFSAFSSSPLPILFFLLSAGITALIVSAGVRGGIERIAIILIPFVFLLLAGMAIYVTTLTGWGDGIRYVFTPDYSVLFNPLIWSAALGQSFFSLSVGQGILITYGAYIGEGTNIPRSSLIITVADISASLLAGCVIFPVVFTFGLAPAIGAKLAFSTLPRAFEVMPFGRIFALAFFLLLFFAAITSAISMLEVPASAVIRSTGWSRRRVIFLLLIVLVLLGLPSALSYSNIGFHIAGIRFLDLMDETVGTVGLILTAILISLAFSWKMGPEQYSQMMGENSRILSLIRPLTRYVIPAMLIIALIYRVVRNLDIPAWRIVPGTPFVGALQQILLTSFFLGTLALLVIIFCRLRACQWRPWR